MAAIGSPFGERQSLSIGVISALDRTIRSLTQFEIGDAIQTDAAINPGNSGGPLLDAEGQVIGINAQIKSQSGGGEGVGFAVPVDAVRRSLRELREKGRVDYGYLGVETLTIWPQLAERIDLHLRTGALVQNVVEDSPAENSGLEAGNEDISFQGDDITVGGDLIVGGQRQAVDARARPRGRDQRAWHGRERGAHPPARRRAAHARGRARAPAGGVAPVAVEAGFVFVPGSVPKWWRYPR